MRVTLHRLFAAALLATTPLLASTEAGGAAPVPGAPNNKTENAMAAARKALDEVGDMNYQARSLTDVINDVKQKTKVPVVLDNQVFQFGLDPNQPVVTVNLKQVKLRDGLKAALAPYNLKFGLTAEGVYISTEEGVITRQLRQRVSVDCDGTTFARAARQLALDTGANVVVDPRLGKLADKPITLKLDDVPLETAIRLLAEVADLRAVRSSNVLFVTSHDKVKERGLTDDGPTNPSPLSPFFPAVGGGFNPPPGVIGGGIFVPGGIAPPVPAIEVAPLPDPATPPAAPEKPAQAPPPPPVEKKP
jgi:hypothetical protein